MTSVSKARSSEGDASINTLTSLTKHDETIYKELSSLSQKIRSLDESYYGGGTDIIPDEEYDALARREAELCTAFPHLQLRLEEETGLGKEATRFGGRVGQSYKKFLMMKVLLMQSQQRRRRRRKRRHRQGVLQRNVKRESI